MKVRNVINEKHLGHMFSSEYGKSFNIDETSNLELIKQQFNLNPYYGNQNYIH